MKRYLKKEEGITLIELLASLSILSIVIILVGSVHLFGQKQFASQSESNNLANDLRYSLSVISTEVRSSTTHIINRNYDAIELDGMAFNKSGSDLIHSITRDNDTSSESEEKVTIDHITLSKKVEMFKIIPGNNPNTLDITLIGQQNKSGHSETYSTTIYLRRGSNVQISEE